MHEREAFQDVAPRRWAEVVLRESEPLFASILDIAIEAIIAIDGETQRIILFNQGAERIFSYSSNEAIGQPLDFLLPEGYRIRHKNHVIKFARSAEVVRQMGERQEITGRRKDGEVFPAEASISKVEVASGTILTVILRDITEQKQAEAALRRSEARFRAIVEDQTELICRFLPNGDLTFVNGAYCRYFNRQPEELLGVNFFRFIPVEDQAGARMQLASLTQDRPTATYEHPVIAPNGEIRWQQWTDRAFFDDQGQVIELQSVGRDITERKQAEARLQQYAERLQILRRLDQAILAAQSPETIAEAAFSYLQRLAPHDRASIMLIDFETNEPLFLAVQGLGETNIEVRSHLPLSSYGELLQNIQVGDVVIVEDFLTVSGPSEMVQILLAIGLRSALLSPLIAEGRMIGTFNLMAYRPGAFTAEHSQIVREFIDPLAIAIQQAHLRQQIQRHVVELEQRVAERTAKLVETNQQLQQEIGERERVEATLKQRHRELLIVQAAGAAVAYNLDLHFVLDTVTSQLISLLGVEGCTLSKWDREADVVSPIAESSPEYWLDQEAGAQAYSLADYPLTKSVLVEQTATQMTISQPDIDPAELALMQACGIKSLLMLPLVTQGETLGLVELADSRAERMFSGAQIMLAQLLANQAASAIRNAHLYEQAKIAAIDAERQRLARDLHDAVTQTLFSASLLAAALPQLWNRWPAEAQRSLEKLRQLTQGALAEMRTLLMELRPATLTEKKLSTLLGHLGDALTGRTRIPVTIVIAGDPTLLPEVHLVFYRIAQEALNNIGKHADATRVTLQLDGQAEQVSLTIGDDGVGFDPDAIPPGHLGLNIMRERAEAIGASLNIISQPGAGTQIVLKWPDS